MAASASDIRAALNLPSNSSAPTQAQKQKQKRELRVQRELAALVGPRAAPSLVVASKPRLKAKPRLGGGAVKWEQREFANEARTDALKLRHWAKAESDPQAEYPFRKYDVPTPVFTYSDDEYTRLLSNLPVPGEDGEPGESWSREETDYLFDLLREYDLRWYVVADRWEFGGPERKLHDLQDRYYTICRHLIRDRPAESDEQTKNQRLTAHAFDHGREATRRAYAQALVSRSPADIAEEEALFLELKRLEQQERQFRKDRDGLLRTIMGIESGLPEIGVEEQEALALQAPAGFDRKRRRHEDSPATPQTAGTLPFSSTSAAGPSASAGTRRTAQNIEDDARQCITRASPPPSAMAAGMSIKTGTHQPVYLRAFKLPVPKPVIAGKIVQALVEMGVPMINEATMLPEPAAASLGKVGDGVGEGASLRSKQHLQALGGVLGVPSPDSKRGRQLLLRLVMPTRANCVKLERLIDSVGLLMETKMAVDRIEQEIRVAEQRLKMRREGPGTGAPSEQAMEVDEDEGDSVSIAGGREMSVVSNTAEAVRGRPGRRQRSSRRSVSVSSVDTTATSATGRRNRK